MLGHLSQHKGKPASCKPAVIAEDRPCNCKHIELRHSAQEAKACSRQLAFEGIQPTLRQVPPSVPLPSMQVTFMPSWAGLLVAS